jgi:putative hydrolase of the HAD superfamily
MLRAILFDLDDTLIDWGQLHDNHQWEAIEDVHLNKVYQYLTSLGPLNGDAAAYKKAYFDFAYRAWFQASETRIAPRMGTALVQAAVTCGLSEDVVDEGACLRVYDWRAFAEVDVFPDVFEALDHFQKQGLKFGLITNAFQSMWMRDVELDDHGLLHYFPDCRFSAADVGYLKPHPSIFQAALDCLELQPSEAVFVGDNLLDDIGGAQQIGMRGVLRYKPGKLRHADGVEADAIIESLLELPPILDNWFK